MKNYEETKHLIKKSILPIEHSKRQIGWLGYFAMWVGMVVMIVAYSFGATAIASYPAEIALLTIFAGYLGMGAIMLLSADIGTEHGLSFAVYLRAPFGIFGTHFPVVSRGIVAAAWFGVQTYLGALALNGISEYFIGFDNWIVWYAVFAIVQVANTAAGIRAVEIFASFAAPILIGISVWMYFYLDDMIRLEGNNLWTFAGEANTPLLVIFMANFSLWSALAVDIPNITRFLKVEKGERSFFKRNKNIFAAQLIALPICSTFLALIGAAAFVATGNWNPIEIIQQNETGITLILLLGLITLAQWSTNNAANLIPAALAFVNAFAPRLNYPVAVVLAGIVGTLAMPWLILNYLFEFLGYYGGALSAVAGVMFCDYYIIRKRRLNIPDIFSEHGQFRFYSGMNPAGLIAWVVAGGLAIWHLEYAYLIGLPLGAVIYFVLMKFWICNKFEQKEITSGFSDNYLATTVNKEWVYTSDNKFELRTII
ncbi:nitrate reductase [Marinobacter sp. Z-F4-2]|nr:nitrate reductase [Marinobacter sp. Z-F4-2]